MPTFLMRIWRHLMNSTDSQINNIAALEKIKQVAIENKLTELERIIKDIEEKYYP